MGNGVAIICPTRDRPKEFQRLCQSVHETSSARVLGWVDADQEHSYPGEHCSLTCGPRIGPVASANRLVEENPGYEVYGLMTDDSVVTTPGWDEWVLDMVKQFPNRICVISPYHNNGDHVDMPFVTREWIDIVGWYACPDCYHYAWPTISGLIGEMTGIVHAPKQSFAIHHDYVDGTYPERRERDNTAFYNYVTQKMPVVVERLRQAMA